MAKNKKWKRLAKRIQGECGHYYCNNCKYCIECINKAGWGGNYIGIRKLEKRIKRSNMRGE